MVPMGYIPEDQDCAVYNGRHEDPSAIGLYNKRALCRYYQAGSCRRGSSCPFTHLPAAARVEGHKAEHMFAYPLQTPVYRSSEAQAHPVFVWQPYLPTFPLLDSRYGLTHQAEAVPDYPDDKSDLASAESSSMATSMDYQLRMTSDPVWLDRPESGAIRDVASPSGDFGINPSPGYSYPVLPAIKTKYLAGRAYAASGQYPNQSSMVALPPSFSLPWQDDMKKKPLAYKTKPCKYYAANGKCSSGESCTFIHDPESKGSVDKSPAEAVPPANAKLPSKPHNKYDDCRARGFYPITWRVIGGGVMMGGQRQICPAFSAGHCKHGNDCRLAHETELQTDQVGFIDLKSETVQKTEGSSQQSTKDTIPKRSQRRKSIRVPFPETQQREKNSPITPSHPQRLIPAPEGTESARKQGDEVITPRARDTPASPVHRRTQSLSMVLTSPPSDTTQSSYAAEL